MSRFGNLADQYFDDAGDPLVNGKITFYETNTTTLKTTYADINLSIANSNPVLLSAAGRQPNIFFDGVAKAVLATSSGVQIEVRDPIGDTSSSFGAAWLASKIYSANDVVRGSDGVYYESLVSGNQNNDPTSASSASFWSLLYSIEWSSSQTYQTGFMVTGSDQVLYQSLTTNNIGNNPVSSPAYWANPATVAWQSALTYGLDANVTGSDGIIYTSTGAGNIGNDPISSPSNWIRINISWKATVTYPLNANAIGSDGILYQSLVASNINFEPSANATKWVAGTAAAATSAAAALVSANAAAASATTATAMTGTSTTSLAIGTGSKTLTTQSGKTFTVGRYIQIGVTNSGANFMNGQITSYSGTTLVVNVNSIGGSGTHNTWTLDLSGVKGATGNTGGGLAAVVDDTSPQLGGNLDANGHQVQWSKGADVASAAALPLLTDGNSFDCTGTGTITSFDTIGVGTIINLVHTGIQVITHSATNLICLSGANITTAVGDVSEWLEYATGDFRMINYARADGTAVTYVDSALGFTNKSGWADDEQISITLDTAAEGIAKANVSIYEEVAQTGVTNSVWDVITGDLGFTLVDSAYAVTLTPAATTGGSVAFTLGSGSWASTDLGKVIKHATTGEARVISIASGVATCQITVAFADTSAIASGDWLMYSGEFTSGSFELSKATDQVPTPATPVVYESATTTEIGVAMLTATKAVVTYSDGGNLGRGTACVLTISGSTITAGSPAVFGQNYSYSDIVTALTSTTAVVIFGNPSSYPSACLLTISGTSVSGGANLTINTSNSHLVMSVDRLTDTTAIAVYKNASAYGTSVVLSVSGTSLTLGTPVVFNAASTADVSVTSLSATQAMVCYTDAGNSSYGTSCILNVSGTTITAGAEAVFTSSTATYKRVDSLTSTKAVVVYRDGTNTYGTACILDVSGSTITAGTPLVFESAATTDTSVTRLSDTSAVATYTDGGNSSFGTSIILTISGSTITAGTPVVFESASTADNDVVALTATKVVAVYQDTGSSSYGTSIVIDTEANLYVTSQYVSAISGTDTIDTTFYTDLNSVTATETLGGQTANYVFSFNPTLVSSVVTGGSFIVIGTGETTARTIASSLASVHGGVDGTWYYNSHATYASETWSASTVNTTAGAVEQAQTVASNNMTGTDVGNVADGNWPAFGTEFALGIVLYSASTSATPSVDKVVFDYDANVLNSLSYGYTVEMPSTALIKVTAPSSGGPRNARVYISK